jgi:hypothetical protein
MSVFKKSDAKNRLALRFRARTYLNLRVSQSDASIYSLANPDVIGMSPAQFAIDYSAEHTIAGIAPTLTANSIDSSDSREPDTSKSAQA